MQNIIETVDFKSENAGIKFVNSLHHTGFVILHNHPIEYDLMKSVYNKWAQFFISEAKYSYTFNPDLQDGYFPYRSENAQGYNVKDLKEFFHYYQWGKCPSDMKIITDQLFQKLLNIGQELLHWIDSFSPDNIKSNYSMPLSKMIQNSPMNVLRILHYPPLEDVISDGAIRASAHGDINLITVLPAASQPGLQVLNKENEWVNVECNPGWLVINTGDMLSECSKNYFPSTTHQVINLKGDAAKLPRYTMPLFIHPRDEVILSKRYTARSFLDERLQAIGLKP